MDPLYSLQFRYVRLFWLMIGQSTHIWKNAFSDWKWNWVQCLQYHNQSKVHLDLNRVHNFFIVEYVLEGKQHFNNLSNASYIQQDSFNCIFKFVVSYSNSSKLIISYLFNASSNNKITRYR